MSSGGKKGGRRGTPNKKGARSANPSAKGSAPRGSRAGAGRTPPGKKSAGRTAPAAHDPARSAPVEADEPRTFRLGAVAGSTPGKWIGRWRERMPHVPLELVPLAHGSTPRESLAEVDAALLRLPVDDDELHVIRLYDEVPVVVVPIDSELTVADELSPGDLAGQVLIVPRDDVLGELDLPETAPARFEAPRTTEDAVELVATGIGIVVVPQSLARLHHRRDVTHRPLRDGPVSTVALVWPKDRTTPDVDTFVGIVRGRTARSSR